MNGTTKRWLLDAGERTARTFVQGFLGAVTLDAFSDAFNPTWFQNLQLGLLAGVYAILAAFAGKQTGANDSASLLPEHVDPPQP